MSEFDPGAEQSAAGMVGKQPDRDDWADLQTSLGNLAGLVSASLGLDEMLERVASFAAHAIPGADGASVMLLARVPSDPGEPGVAASAVSAPFVADLDRLQHAVLDEGPCVTACRDGRIVRTGSLGGARTWPRFGPRAGRLGVHSALSFPLQVGDHLVGAVNVYARGKDVFDERAEQLGALFAAPAAVAVHNAEVLARARALTAQLQQALASRPAIDQAIGTLRGRTGGSADEAFARLREISQREHVKLVDVAQRIVDEAVRRARARSAR